MRSAPILLTFGLAASTLAAAVQPNPPSVSDQVFVTKAGQGNLFEIDAAKIALSLGQTPAVKAYAQQMITDHTKLGAEVKAAISGTNLMLPTTVSPAQQMQLNALKASKSNFDAQYRLMMVMSHYDTYTVFQSYVKVGHTPPLQRVIEGALPVVKMHWDMAGQLPSL